MDVDDWTGPPAAPEIARALRLTTLQKIGLPVLFIIPILALFGVFGERFAIRAASGSGVAARVSYPDRIHYRQTMPLRIMVWNASTRAADSIMISLDPEFMRAFSAISITPAATRAYTIVLRHVKPGERRVISGDVAGERYGRSDGNVRVAGIAGELCIPVATFVFP